MNQIISNKAEIISEYKIILGELMDTKKLDMEASQVQAEMEVALELLQKCVMENAHIAIDQGDYQHRYSGYAGRYDTACRRLAEINEQHKSISVRGAKAEAFLNSLAKIDGLITEFNLPIWNTMVEHVKVLPKAALGFSFRNGKQIIIGSVYKAIVIALRGVFLLYTTTSVNYYALRYSLISLKSSNAFFRASSKTPLPNSVIL